MPSRVRRLVAAVRNLLFRTRLDRDLDAEVQSYLALAEDEARRHGAGPDAARRLARLELGGAEAVKASVRTSRAGAGLERFSRDVAYALRGLRRAPGFAAIATVTLALGIGANATIFSVVDAALIKPLPYSRPDQLVNIAFVINQGTAEEVHAFGLSWAQLDFWRTQRQIFSDVVTYGRIRPVSVSGVPVTGPAAMGQVSPALLRMLGVPPERGRGFVPDDLRLGSRNVLIADAFWRRAFGADPGILGTSLTIDRDAYTIVGVMPATFSWSVGNRSVIGWLPFDEDAERHRPGSRGAATLFRIRDDLTMAQARRAAEAAARALPRESGTDGAGVELMPFDMRPLTLGSARPALLALAGAVGFVLLIACANVANLLLARLVVRRRELAVRAALGASRGRLLRQLLTEGLVLSALGGAMAVALAAWSTRVIPAGVPSDLALFAANPMVVDAPVLLFCLGAVLVMILLCSVVPAWRASRADIVGSLEGSARVAGAGRGAGRLRASLQAVQVALTLVLLAGAGLLATSFVRMVDTPAGYDAAGLASGQLALPQSRYGSVVAQTAFFDELIAQVRRLPSITAATYGPPPPEGLSGRFVPYGQEQQAANRGELSLYHVDADYFRMAGIPLEAGRLFTSDDGPTSPAVAIIDEHAAKVAWPGESPLGQRFRYSPYVPWITVVGVVGHVKTRSFASSAGTIQAYLPTRQNSSQRYRTLLVRTKADAETAFAPISRIVHQLDPGLDVSHELVVADEYGDAFTTPQFYLVLASLLAGLALIVAAVGLYGVLNYSVGQRSREIAVRVALGARRSHIRRVVVADALGPVVLGSAAGLAGALWLTRFLRSMLYDTTSHDPITYAAVVAGLLVVAALAALVPAIRATRVDPISVLKTD
jgi:putative ABC transport system permease protein